MERSEDSSRQAAKASTKEKVSGLIDGDADPDGLRALMAQLREAEGRQAWDLYHQIGDAIRSADPGPAMSADFDQRFAARFAAEPILLPPRRNVLARLGAWPTTLAAVAAAGFGFFIAPSLMRDAGPSLPVSTTAATRVPAPAAAVPPTASMGQGPAMAQVAALSDGEAYSQASGQVTTPASADGDGTLDYITLHHRAHASLYGATPAIRPVVLEAAPHR